MNKIEPSFDNELIISLDCVHRGALSCNPQRVGARLRYPQGDRTPNVDRLSGGGHRFDQANNHAPLTPVAHASLHSRSWKLIWDRLNDSQEFFRIYLDPGEKNDLASSKPEVVNQLLPRMQELAGEMPVAGLLSAEVVMIKRLEALGYL